jgi:uncharacterized OsmC-like protein
MSQELSIEVNTESRGHTELEVSVRGHKLKVDEPESFGGSDKGANPLEYLFAGLAGCLNVTIHQVARERKVKIDKLNIDVKGTLDLEGFMNKDSDKRSGFQRINVEVDIKTDSDEETENKILEEAEKRCPVSDTIQEVTSIKLEKKSSE